MSDRAYFYFKDLYAQTSEYIICVNENLKVIYISDAFRQKFESTSVDDTLLNCFISKRYAVIIQKATQLSKSISFDYIHPSDKEIRHCTVIPHTIYNAKYSTLIISELSRISYNDRALHQLKLQINNAEDNVHEKISLINSFAGYIKEHPEKINEFSNKIINLAVNVRREFDDIAIVSRGKPSNFKLALCNVDEYLELFAHLTVHILGPKRIRFDLDFSDVPVLANTSYEILDYLFSTVVCHLISDTKGMVEITVSTYNTDDENIIILTTHQQSFDELAELIKSNTQIIDSEIPVVSRLLENNGGRLITILNRNNNKTVAFALEKYKARRLIFREQDKLQDTIDERINSLTMRYASEIDVTYNYSNY